MILKYRMLVSETLGDNRTTLMAALKEHDVKAFTGADDGLEKIPCNAIRAQKSTSITGLICLFSFSSRRRKSICHR